jgi:5-oxoprolinase (ATP-hydrolysing) subunit B
MWQSDDSFNDCIIRFVSVQTLACAAAARSNWLLRGMFHVKRRWVTERGLWLESGTDTLALIRAIERVRPEEVEALVPGDGSLLVVLKPGTSPGKALSRLLESGVEAHPGEREASTHEIRAVYGGEAGPDLAIVAAAAGLTIRECIELHTSAEFRVAFLGFQPGFAYLEGTPPALQTDRRSTPRVRIPAGSLALGGGYTGIYPGVSAGGWQVIGRTSEWLFDPHRTPPARFAPGDRVRFLAA